jgi:Flp pilus assembly protein TadB
LLIFATVMVFLAVLCVLLGIRSGNPVRAALEKLAGERPVSAGDRIDFLDELWGLSASRLDRSEALGVGAAAGVAAGALALAVTGVPAAAVCALPGAVFAPRFWGRRKANKRRRLFSEQMPAVVGALAAAVRGGASLMSAFDYAAREAPLLRDDLARVAAAIRAGASLASAVRAFARDIDVPEAEELAAAVILLHETGGGEGGIELLDGAAESARAKRNLRHLARAHTAQIRVEGAVAGAIPLAVFALCFFGIGGEFREMVYSPEGRALLLGALGLIALGWASVFAIMSRVTDPTP